MLRFAMACVGLLAAPQATLAQNWSFDAREIALGGVGSTGNLATAGNLVLQGTDTGQFYAFDAKSGRQLFTYKAPRAIRASPLTYRVNGKQYVVIAAGGGKWGAPSGGSYVAFALP